MDIHFVYILYSPKLDRCYTGQTFDLVSRLEKHNSGYYEAKWTLKGIPWEIFCSIECENKSQALAIEKHIKSMKSRAYIENLKKYPEMTVKLLEQFSSMTDC